MIEYKHGRRQENLCEKTVKTGITFDPLEPDDSFPKGLYLRSVNGTLWLRGFVCDNGFVFNGCDLFAFDCGPALLP